MRLRADACFTLQLKGRLRHMKKKNRRVIISPLAGSLQVFTYMILPRPKRCKLVILIYCALGGR